MPRRRGVLKREILPDPKFGNVEVTRFMNVLMLDGRKPVAERTIYDTFDQIEKKSRQDADRGVHAGYRQHQAGGRSEEPSY